jgi:hypothetical protein
MVPGARERCEDQDDPRTRKGQPGGPSPNLVRHSRGIRNRSGIGKAGRNGFSRSRIFRIPRNNLKREGPYWKKDR